MAKYGKFTFVLHSHLPYVINHGKWPFGMDWLNEAAAETYIPLLNVFNRLVNEGISPKVTIGITPILTEQLASKKFKESFIEYLNERIKAAVDAIEYFEKIQDNEMKELAIYWRNFYQKIHDDFIYVYNQDIPNAFKILQDNNHLEIITCGATHGYFPLLSKDESIQLQVKQGVSTYKKHYGRQPKGIWLPECAYRPRYPWCKPVDDGLNTKQPYLRKGVDEFLTENGIQYFIVDTHLLKGGKAIGTYFERFEALKFLLGQFEKYFEPIIDDFEHIPYEPYYVSSNPEKSKPAAIFTRDAKTSLQVWSGEHGYPGDGYYLEFHKKHFPSGHKFWRITSSKSDLADKRIYELNAIEGRLYSHSEHFVNLIIDILKENYEKNGKKGILTAPFDTELFGHWWFEGPEWIYKVIKSISLRDEIEMQTCGEYLEENPPAHVISIPEGSWGEGGHHYVWLNQWTEWTWPHIYRAEEKIHQRITAYFEKNTKDNLEERILKQILRELLLLEASDWQFLITTWSAKEYAEKRVVVHEERINKLIEKLDKYNNSKEWDDASEIYLSELEREDEVFEEIDLNWFYKVDYPAE